MKIVFVASIIRNSVCIIYVFYFFQKSLFTENYFLITAINLATRGPLYTCLVLLHPRGVNHKAHKEKSIRKINQNEHTYITLHVFIYKHKVYRHKWGYISRQPKHISSLVLDFAWRLSNTQILDYLNFWIE